MKKILTLCFLAAAFGVSAEYVEPKGGDVVGLEKWLDIDYGLNLTWASKDVQYARRAVPEISTVRDTTVSAWRGERLGIQALVYSREDAKDLTVTLDNGTAAWARYVITEGNRGCGDHYEAPTWTVADIIDLPGTSADIEKYSVRPIWCTIEIPRDIPAGTYPTTLRLWQHGKPVDELTLNVRVVDRTLPEVADQKFYLDFWQQPYSVSRYYDLERWSPEHFEALRPYMKALARAGQKVVSAILFYEPWGRQSFDKFDPMVETYLRADSTWAFDFSIFDRWVEFMDECGINSRINCYSMVPWDMTFRYIYEPTGRYEYLKTTTDSPEYRELWTAFLSAFASHLKEKGWFEKTAIAMDERGLGAMQDALAIVNSAAPGLKVALAGNYHPEITAELDDYSITYSQRFPAEELQRRHKAGQISTSYVCCADPGANIFTNNAPSDAAYLPLQAIAAGFDGILHWSWLNWNQNPLRDSRLQLPGNGLYTFAPGDTYSFYPGPRSSVRFERLIEGIQQAEKVRILGLESALEPFASGRTDNTARLVNELESLLNQ